MYSELKAALLCALEEWPNGGDLATLADYAAGEGVSWTEDDRSRLFALADRYLDKEFWEELGDYDPNDLAGLSQSLDTIGSYRGLDITDLQSWCTSVYGGSSDLDPDDDDQPIRSWDEAQDDIRINPAEEVKRLFH